MGNDKLIAYLHKQSFQPSLLSLFINPFYLIRNSLASNIKAFAPLLKGKLLDFGCGRKPYENLFNVDEYIGLDIEVSGHNHQNSKVDVFYDGKVIPFANETFDSLFCSEVLEHVFEPNDILAEINRVLKKDALAIITVPFCWNEHEVPYDYARYSSFGISYLLEKNNFEIVQIRKSGSFARVVGQLVVLYVFEIFRKYKRVGFLMSLLFIAPFNLVACILLPLFPKNTTLFFNSIVLAKKRG